MLARISGADGGAAVGDGADLELHAGQIGGGLQHGVGLQGTIDLIVVALRVAVGIGAVDGRGGDVQTLAINSDIDCRDS